MSDGPDVKSSESEAKAEANTPDGTPSEVSGQLPAPSIRFSEDGEYFVVRVHINYGYVFILGWLEKAKDFMKMHVSKQMAEMQKRSLIKPTKGLGRISNIFKR